MQKNKGFTLIELLVVIAIIGILASVVLGSLTKAREKGVDSSIKADLKSIPAQAEIYASYNGFTYTGVCVAGTNTVKKMIDNAAINAGVVSAGANTVGTTSTATCNENGSAWAAEVPLKIKNNGTTNMFCIDSAGFVGTRSTSMGNTANCPVE